MIIEAVKLKNGHTIPLKSLNLLIGPNNSGKSTFLQDLQGLRTSGLVLDSFSPKGLTMDEIKAHLEEEGKFTVPAPNGGSWNKDNWEEAQPFVRNNFDHVSNHLLKKIWGVTTIILDGKARLSIVDDKPYQGIDEKKNLNVFETLRQNHDLKAELQKHVQAILPGKYFALWTPKPATLRAYICDREPIQDIEYYDSPAASSFFRQHATPVTNYSDGIKAYIGILINIIAGEKHQLLIDEPEAFLHPNLCFKLGQTLSNIVRSTNKLCFCATHSPYLLKGCLSQNPKELSVTRFEYEHRKSNASTLETDDLLSIIHDPLLNNIGVTEGLFHSRVVVTEGDSDRAFYNEVNNRMIAHTEKGIRDCLFINAQNKQTIAKVIGLFRRVSIPCAAISDIDTLKEGGIVFSNIIESISINGASAEALTLLRDRVHQQLTGASRREGENSISYEQIEGQLTEAKAADKSAIEFLSSLRGKTKAPDYKRLGGISLLSGSEVVDANNLLDQLRIAGWFVVPKGEVENWLGSLDVGTSKTGWLLRIFSKMGSDPSDGDYVRPPDNLDDVWEFISRIADWFASQNTG